MEMSWVRRTAKMRLVERFDVVEPDMPLLADSIKFCEIEEMQSMGMFDFVDLDIDFYLMDRVYFLSIRELKSRVSSDMDDQINIEIYDDPEDECPTETKQIFNKNVAEIIKSEVQRIADNWKKSNIK